MCVSVSVCVRMLCVSVGGEPRLVPIRLASFTLTAGCLPINHPIYMHIPYYRCTNTHIHTRTLNIHESSPHGIQTYFTYAYACLNIDADTIVSHPWRLHLRQLRCAHEHFIARCFFSFWCVCLCLCLCVCVSVCVYV